MNKNYTLKELADIGAGAAYMAVEGTKMSLIKDSEDQLAQEAFTKAILDAIGYEFPKDEEREAFERWLAEQGDGFHPCGDVDKAFAVWKAGREELRRAQMEAKEKDKSELPEPPAYRMKVCYMKDMPKDSNPYGKSMWAFGGWVGLFPDSKPSPDTIVAYLPESKVNEGYLTAEYKTEPAWIPWEGGECPLGDTVKRWEYEVRAGVIEPGEEIKPRHLRWSHTGGDGDIVAYRVIEG